MTPVFLHIPKNAGTYVLGYTMEMFRCYGLLNGWNIKKNWNIDLRRVSLTEENGTQIANLFIHDPYEIRNSSKYFISHPRDAYCNIIYFKEFIEEISNNNLFVFSILIEPGGVKYIKNNVYDQICEKNNSTPFYYTIFRDPYERALSLYNYLTSFLSNHERTHGLIKAATFEEYLVSYQLEDSWLIRELLGLPDNIGISHEHFQQACTILDKFKIKNIYEIDLLLRDVFSTCYDLTKEKIQYIWIDSINKNANPKNKIKSCFESLDEETKEIYLDRTQFDYSIYKRYC
jgi:hypothetical protein